MTKKNYEKLKKKVMASTNCEEIRTLINKFSYEEYESVQYATLTQHLFACTFHEVAATSYGFELTWDESSLGFLQEIADNIRDYRIQLKKGLRPVLSNQMIAFLSVCSVFASYMKGDGSIESIITFAILIIGDMFSEIIMMRLNMIWDRNPANGNTELTAHNISCYPRGHVGLYIEGYSRLSLPTYYKRLKKSLEPFNNQAQS